MTTILLAAAGLATSWVTYQAVRWAGVQAAYFSQASMLATRASVHVTIAAQQRAINVGLFTAWLTAMDERQTQLKEFIRQRFRPEFAGISQQARRRYMRLTLLILAAIGCCVGIRNIIVFPIH